MPTKAKKAIAKSKTSSKAKSKGHRLDISFSGGGTQAYAYVVNNDFIAKWKLSREDEEAEYFDVSTELDEYAIDCYRVCMGMNEEPEIKIELDGKVIECNGMVREEYEDDYEPEQLDYLMKIEAIEAMGEGFEIPEGFHIVIEVIEYDDGLLSTCLDIAVATIKPSELTVLTRDVDTDTELSRATYGNWLLNEVEGDMVQIKYKDEIVDFDLDFSGISSGGYFLVSKDANGSLRGYDQL
jgi:hypothetical protein